MSHTMSSPTRKMIVENALRSASLVDLAGCSPRSCDKSNTGDSGPEGVDETADLEVHEDETPALFLSISCDLRRDTYLGQDQAASESILAVWQGLSVRAKVVGDRVTASRRKLSKDERPSTADSPPDLKTMLWHLYLKELHTVAALRHPNLLQVFGVQYHQDLRQPECVITEYAEHTLSDILYGQKIELYFNEIVDIAIDVAAALDFLHGCPDPIIHGAVHCRNVYLMGRVAKLGDAGIASSVTLASCSRPSSKAQMRKATGLVGVRLPTFADDITSLGTLILEMILGASVQSSELRVPRLIQEAAAKYKDVENILKAAFSDNPQACTILMLLREVRASSESDVYREESTPFYAHIYFISRSSSCESFSKFAIVERRRAEKLSKTGNNDELYEKKLEDAAKKLKVLEKREDALKDMLVQEQKQHDVVSKRLAEKESQLSTAQSSLLDLQKVRVALEIKFAKAEEDLLAATEVLRRSEEDVQGLKAQLAEKDHLLSKRQRALDNQEVNLGDLRAKVQDLGTKLEEANSAKQISLAQAQEALSEGAKVKTLCEELQARLDQALHRWEQEKSNRLSAEARYKQARSENQQLGLALKEYDPENGSKMLGVKRFYEDQIQILTRHLKEAQLQSATDTKKSEDLSQQVISLKQAQEVLTAEVNTWKEKHKAVADINAAQTENLNEQLGRIGALSKDLERARKNVADLVENVRKLQEDLAVWKDRAEKAEKAKKEKRCLSRDCDSPPFMLEGNGFCKLCNEKRAEQERLKAEAAAREKDPQVLLEATLPQGPRAVVDMLRTRLENAELQHRGLRVLRRLANDAGAREVIGSSYGVELAVANIDKHGAVQPVVEAALHLLGTLSFENDYNRIRIVAANGIPAIIGAMRSLVSDLKVAEKGCTALTNLAHNSDRNRLYIVDQGGVPAVLDCMQAFLTEASLQKKACWALLALAGSEPLSQKIAAEGGIGAVMAAMLNCAKDEEVQQYASWALANILAEGDELQAFALEEGAKKVCEVAKLAFSSNPIIQEKTTTVIELLQKHERIPSSVYHSLNLPDR